MKQSRRLEGSFTNYLMGNNSSTPEVGKGATLLSYSDRYPAEVLEVSADGKRCVIREMSHRAKNSEDNMGHQDWDIFPNPDAPTETLVYRNGAWRKVIEQIVYDNNWDASFSNHIERWEEEKRIGLRDEEFNLRLMKGITKIKRSYDKVNILFGRVEYHYDWEF